MFKRSFLVLGLLLLMVSCGRDTTSPVPTRPPAVSASPTGPVQPVQATFTPETALTATPPGESAQTATPLPQPNPPLPIPVLALTSDPFDSRAVYALLANLELYRTIDGGQSWQRLPFPALQPDYDPAQAGDWLEPDPGDLRFSVYQRGQLFLRAGGVLYASQDGGESWLALIEKVTTWFVDDEGTRLYAWLAGEAPGLFRSADGGQSWLLIFPREQPEGTKKALFQPEEVISLVIGNISDAELFASTAGSVFRSPDGGESWWEQPLDGLPAQPQRIHLFKAHSFGADLYALVQTSAGPFLARFDRGWVSPDQDHWEILGAEGSAGLAAFVVPGAASFSGIFTLLVDPYDSEQLYLGTASGLLFSPDGGQSWEQHELFEDEPVLRLAYSQSFEPALYAGTEAGVAVGRLVESTASEPVLPTFDELVQLELVAQAGGSLGPYVATGDLVYAALGPYLAAIEFGEVPASPQVAWRSPALAAEIRALALDGDSLYVVTRDGRLHRYDLTDPRVPELDASAPISPETSWLAVQGDLAALVETHCRGNNCQARLLTLDLSPPFEARVTGSFDLPGPSRGLHLAGSLIFVAYNYGLLAVDVAGDSTQPQLLAQYISGQVRHVEFADPYAYLSLGSSLEVLDLSGVLDLTEPYEIARLGEAHADREQGADFYLSTFTLSSELVYGFDTFGEFGYCWSSTFIIDVSDPAKPTFEVGGEDLPGLTCAGKPQAVGERLYVPDWDGLHLLDLSDPLQPQPLGLLAVQPGSASLIPYLGEYLYWASRRSDTSLHLLDLRDPTAPTFYGPLAPGWTYGSAISGSYLIAPAFFNGLQVIDLEDPFRPQVVASIPTEQIGEPGYVTVAGNYAYVNVDGDRLVIVDLRDPLQPVIAGQYGPAPSSEPQVGVSAPAVSGSYAYLAESQERDRQELAWLRVLDVSDPTNPQELGQAAVPGKVQSTTRPALSGEMAYLPAGKGIAVVDVSDPANPRAAGWLNLPGGAFDVAFSGQYLLVAGGQAGLWVVDVSHPAQPVLVGHYDTPGSCSQVAVVGEMIYVNDGSAGALLLRIRLE